MSLSSQTNQAFQKNQINEINKTNEIYKKIITPKLTKIVSTIENIAEQNNDETKSKETKQAEACFALLEQNMNSICNNKDHDGYGLKFCQCMDCSH